MLLVLWNTTERAKWDLSDLPDQNKVSFFEELRHDMPGRTYAPYGSADSEFFLYNLPITHDSEHVTIWRQHDVGRGAIDIVNYTTHATYSSPAPEQIRINTVVITGNINAHFETIKQIPAELKHISLGLAEDRYHKIRVFNTADNTLVVFTNRTVSYTLIRKLTAVLPALFPAYFADLNIPIELFTSLVGPKDVWYQLFDTWLTNAKLIEARQEQAILKLVQALEDREVTQCVELISNTASSIRNLNDQLRTHYRNLRENQLKLVGIQQQGNNAFTEFVRYVRNKPNVTELRVYDGGLLMRIHAPCMYQESIIADLLRSPRSPWTDAQKLILKAIFIDKKYTLHFKAPVYMNISEPEITARAVEFRTVQQIFGMYNPHLYGYNCWGTNEPRIIKALSERNYIIALEQTVSAVGNINWADGAAVSKFNELLRSQYSVPCCLDKEGNELSLREIYTKEVNTDETNPSD